MKLLFNDLSLCGQFEHLDAFTESIKQIMKMRTTARKFGFALYCHKNMREAKVTAKMNIAKAINHFSDNRKKALTQWIAKGPYWEDEKEQQRLSEMQQ